MRIQLGEKSLTILVTAALLVLPPLGWLQYRWIGEISEAEEERRRDDVTAALERVAEDIERDAMRRQAEVIGPVVGGGMALEDRLQSLDLQGEGIPIRRLFTVSPDPERTWLTEEWDASEGGFRPIPTPEWWVRKSYRGPVHVDPPALISSLGPFAETPRVLVMELDTEQMRRSYFPALVRRHFGAEGSRQFAIRIVRAEGDRRVLYESGQWQGAPDAGVPLLRGARPLQAGPPGPRRGGFSDGKKKKKKKKKSDDGPFGAGEGFGPNGGPPPESAWMIEVRHLGGSLDTVVGRTRVRNLAVITVTLLLLGAALMALVHALRRARRLAQLQLEFTAGVSHELKTPLAVIVSAGDNLAGGYVRDPERVKEYGALVRDEGTRLTGMVDQVLRFSALESDGGPQLEMHPLRAPSVVASVEKEMRPVAESHGCEWDVSSEDIGLRGDAGALHAAVRNLVENAIRHGWQGKWIRLRAFGEGGSVRFVVEDRGPGIPAVDLPHLFEPFYRGVESRAQQRKGSGLGLALVQRIARAHGGDVQVENRAEGGARFTLTLPAEEQ